MKCLCSPILRLFQSRFEMRTYPTKHRTRFREALGLVAGSCSSALTGAKKMLNFNSGRCWPRGWIQFICVHLCNKNIEFQFRKVSASFWDSVYLHSPMQNNVAVQFRMLLALLCDPAHLRSPIRENIESHFIKVLASFSDPVSLRSSMQQKHES